MRKQLSDEQLDKLMQALISDAAADDGVVNEIADSPAVWWGVQRRIKAGKDSVRSPWPPRPKVWRWLMIGVPAAAVLAISFFVMRPAKTPGNLADNITQPTEIRTFATPIVERAPLIASESDTNDKPIVKSARQTIAAPKFNAVSKRTFNGSNPTAKTVAKKDAEIIATDFIALSYARDAESGQIVRVKVPSSMMVTLGLVSTVEKPSRLVDAEIVVGDDGLTRAIRFIRF